MGTKKVVEKIVCSTCGATLARVTERCGQCGGGHSPPVTFGAPQAVQGQGDVYLKTYCAQAANGTGNTDTFPGERLRRLTRRLGATKAMCAVGRSILVIVWYLLADPAARFTDPGPGWHDQQAGRDRRIRSHLRQLKALGVEVTVNTAAA